MKMSLKTSLSLAAYEHISQDFKATSSGNKFKGKDIFGKEVSISPNEDIVIFNIHTNQVEVASLTWLLYANDMTRDQSPNQNFKRGSMFINTKKPHIGFSVNKAV